MVLVSFVIELREGGGFVRYVNEGGEATNWLWYGQCLQCCGSISVEQLSVSGMYRNNG